VRTNCPTRPCDPAILRHRNHGIAIGLPPDEYGDAAMHLGAMLACSTGE
jgi:hypothetical protein